MMQILPFLLLLVVLYVFFKYVERVETLARIDPQYAKELLPKIAISAGAIIVVLVAAILICNAVLSSLLAWFIAIPYLIALGLVELVLLILGNNVLNITHPR